MAMTSTADRMRQIQAVRNARPFHQKARDWMRDRARKEDTSIEEVTDHVIRT